MYYSVEKIAMVKKYPHSCSYRDIFWIYLKDFTVRSFHDRHVTGRKWILISGGLLEDHSYYIRLINKYQYTYNTNFIHLQSIKLYQLYKCNKKPAEAGSLQEKKYMRKCKTITPAYCVINLWLYYNLINVKTLSKNSVNFMKIVKNTSFNKRKLSFCAIC